MRTQLSSLFLMIFLGAFATAKAATESVMDSETQDLVIKKMERVISMLEPQDPSYAASQQRLADLLAERARRRFLLEIEKSCQGCQGSQVDRDRAIGLYESLLKSSRSNARILFQLAHLYQMAGQSDKSQKLFENVLALKKSSRELRTRSHVGVADLLFQQAKFNQALFHYQKALEDSQLEARALVLYNKGWCEFNLDRTSSAIQTLTQLLSRPDLLVRETEKGPVQDVAFQLDILRDLATFLGKVNVQLAQIEQFEKLIPAGHRKDLLFHFAEELDRIGQKKAAQIVLDRYLQDRDLTSEDRLKAHLMKAQVLYDQGQTEASTQDFAQAAKVLKSQSCRSEESCRQLQTLTKRYVTELHRTKKLKPDSTLLRSYQIYADIYPQDREMLQRGAQVALDLGLYASAIHFYRQISDTRDFDRKDREAALLNQVSAAEASQDPKLKREVYTHFLDHSKDPQKTFEVRYQLAYLDYQDKKLREASEAFFQLAKESQGSMTLRKKSADLALDSLAQLKDDQRLENWAWDLATVFPKSAVEFEGLARKALINQAAQAALQPKVSNSTLENLLERLDRANLKSASHQEKVLVYTNASVIAQRLKDEEAYLKSLTQLLALKALSENDRQRIYLELVTYYETRLRFAEAYQWALRRIEPQVSLAEREFRLGTLADMAHFKPEKHYRKALQAGLKGPRSFVVRARLVSLSSSPVAELHRQAPELRRRPELFHEVLLDVYVKSMSRKSLELWLQTKDARSSLAARLILGEALHTKINAQKRALAVRAWTPDKGKLLARQTQQRLKGLSKLDSLLAESLQARDISAQVQVLDLIRVENAKLAEDLKAIPVPRGLTALQLRSYERALDQRLRPLWAKSQLADSQIRKIWMKSAALDQLLQDYTAARPEVQNLLRPRLAVLEDVPGEGRLKSHLDRALSMSSYTRGDLQEARLSVSKNPHDLREIENLKNVEHKIGHPLMPAYLEARIGHLRRGKRL
ncbi:MAG: tetratricopeptide repeat protein [Bdellovibrionales bacterium]